MTSPPPPDPHPGVPTPPREPSGRRTLPPGRHVAAPQLREVAQIWWDVDRDPVVTWDAAGRDYVLVDPGDVDAEVLHLVRLSRPAIDPARVGRALAEGLASCDFPPTGTGASPERARRTLRAAGLVEDTESPG